MCDHVRYSNPQSSTSTMDPQLSGVLKVLRLSGKARLPQRGSAQAAGYDLFSARDIQVPAKGKAEVDLDISIELPSPNCYGRIAPRSGLTIRNFIDVGAGVIDADFRGAVKVVLFNFSDTNFQIKTGDRIAQLIIEPIIHPSIVDCAELVKTTRDQGGFGSTGV